MYRPNTRLIAILWLLISSSFFIGCGPKTALTQAVSQGNLVETQQLVNAGEDLNQFDDFGKTPLIYAVEENNLQMVEFLLDKRANPNLCKNNIADCPLVLASGYKGESSSQSKEDNLQIISALLNAGADVNQREPDDLETPFYVATREGKIGAVKLLMKHGADIHAYGYNQFTPLTIAAQEGHYEILKILVKKGADIHTVDTGGYLTLAQAGVSGNLKLVKYLVEELGADINQQQDNGGSLLYFASNYGHVQVVDYAIAAGAKVDHYYKNEWTPLTAAITQGHSEVVKSLLAAGADPEKQKHFIWKGKSYSIAPLQFLVDEQGDEKVREIGSYLLAAGADINTQSSSYNWTALHNAAYSGWYTKIKFLLENGANPNIRDIDGDTPLDLAKNKGYRKTTDYLLSYGGRTNNYRAPKKSDDSFGKLFATMAIAGLAGQADLSADQTAEVMSATVNDIWVEDGRGTQLASMYEDSLKTNPEEVSNPVVRELVEKRQQHRATALNYQKEQLKRRQAEQQALYNANNQQNTYASTQSYHSNQPETVASTYGSTRNSDQKEQKRLQEQKQREQKKLQEEQAEAAKRKKLQEEQARAAKRQKEKEFNTIVYESIAFIYKTERGNYKGEGPTQKLSLSEKTKEKALKLVGCSNHRSSMGWTHNNHSGEIYFCNEPLQSYDRDVATIIGASHMGGQTVFHCQKNWTLNWKKYCK